ncbi:MAG: 23S rRNA (guanosine(2251)-2'-O)-methyltransferase RlmB [Bacteroidota bacterium]|nr:23S rRNA (guanosine(2251)-2'-O)-methyltransferase RlmB [Bacteroidota bacterium]
MSKTSFIYGIRAIIEAIESGKEIDKIYLLKGGDGVLAQQLKKVAGTKNISTSYVPIEKLDHLAKGNHQGAVARIAAISYSNLEEILEKIDLDTNPTFLVLDGITDVRNFGAIARTAECTGIAAIIIPTKGSASINADAIKTSAGALFNIPICKVNHVKDALFMFQSYGIQLAGATEKVDQVLYNENLNIPIAVVMGSEERGIQPSIIKMLDYKIKLPMLGEIASLNVSVACGAILYEITRQKMS